MKLKLVFLLIAFAAMVSSVATWSVCCLGSPVEYEDKATAIARAHVWRKYHSKFEEYEITTWRECNTWVVSYSLPPEFDDNGEKIEYFDGGGPTVRIRASNGKITSSYIQ